MKWAAELERKLADQLVDIDVIQINRDIDKNEKFAFVRLFTTMLTMQNYNPRVLVAAPATNTIIPVCLNIALP